ncbi:MAG: zinc-finger domain-containing protein [Halothiobacillus sp.]
MNPDTAAHPGSFKIANAVREVQVTQADLPVYCPREDELLWNAHPRVYIHLEKPGDMARCIYCSTVYRLVD